MKPGIKTTEFWVSTIIAVFGVLVATGVITPEQNSALSESVTQIAGAIMSAAGAFGYAVSRGNAKKGGE